jgi:hypothetical protein
MEKGGKGLSNRADKENPLDPNNIPHPAKDIPKDPPELSWDDFIKLLQENHESAFELTAFVVLPHNESTAPQSGFEQAKFISNSIRSVTGYRFKLVQIWVTLQIITDCIYSYHSVRHSKASAKVNTYVFYCAQLKGEETKNKISEDRKKRRARMKMDRFNCNGWLNVNINDDEPHITRVRITHYRCHQPYTDISVSTEVETLVESLKNMSAAQVMSHLA